MKIKFCWRLTFKILIIHKPILKSYEASPFKNLGPFGPAVLTFIWCKQTNKQAERQNIKKIKTTFDFNFDLYQAFKQRKQREHTNTWKQRETVN